MLATEMYTVKNWSSPEIMNEIFQLRQDNHYTLHQVSQFIVPHVNSIFNLLTTNFSSYRNQSVDLLWKSTDWFLYDGNIGR